MLEIKNVYANDIGGALCGVEALIDGKGIYGIIGAHKGDLSLLAEVICGCRDAESGAVELNGQPMSRGDVETRRRARLVPEYLELLPSITAVEYLDFVGDVFKIDSEKKYRLIKESMEFVGLDGKENISFERLGSGDRFRLSLAAALIGNPECIVVANSMAHISPAELNSVCELLKTLGMIKTVILLSSSAPIVKKLCSQVYIVCGGRIVLSGGVDEIEKKINATKEINLTVRGNIDAIVSAIKEKVEGVIEVTVGTVGANSVNTLTVECRPDTKMKDKLYSALSEINAPMLSYREIVLTLDDVFFSLTASDKQREEQGAKKNSKKARNGK